MGLAITPTGLENWMETVGDDLCRTWLAAEAAAKSTRAKVDAYIQPVFERFSFTSKWDGKPITKPNDLYLTDEDCTAYYAACDIAHREQGYNLPEGHCPALVAEHEQLKAEWALLEAAGKLLGIDGLGLWGDNRKQLLDILRDMYSARLKKNRRLRQLVRETIGQ